MDNAYEGVIQWITQARAAGLSDTQITEQLVGQGWQVDQVQKILHPVAHQPTGAPVTVQTQTPTESVRTEIQQAFDPNVKVKGKSWPMRHLVLLVSVAGGLLILGGVAFAAIRGYIPLPFLQKNGEKILADTLRSLETVKSGEASINVTFGAQTPKEQEQNANASALKKIDSDSASNAGQIRTGLALYYDKYVAFPKSLDALLQPTQYVSKLPTQPAGYEIIYTPSADGQDYTLTYACASDKTKSGRIEYSTFTTTTCTSGDTQSSGSDLLSNFGLGDFISSDTTITATLTTFFSTDTTDVTKLRGTFKLQGSYVSGGTTYAADVEARLIDRKVYIIANTFPSFPMVDTESFSKKWYMVGQELTQPYFDQLSKQNTAQQDIQSARTEIASLLQLGVSTQAIVVGKVTKEDLDGSSAYKVPVTFDSTKFSTLAKAYEEDTKKRNVKEDITETIIDMLAQGKPTDGIVPTLTLTIWSNPANAMFRKAELAVTATEGTGTASTQARMTLAITLAYANEQPIVVEPTNATPLMDALGEILGGPRAEARNSQRKSDLGQLRTGLALYYDDKVAYPTTLQALVDRKVISRLPTPPNPDEQYTYKQLEKGKTYKLCGTLEKITEDGIASTYCVLSDGTTSEEPIVITPTE